MQHTSNYRWQRVILFTLAAFMTSALAQSTLTIGRAADVSAMNPFLHANNATSEVTYQIHEGLVTFSADISIQPALAHSWELLDDGVTWRFYLREGISFHSGNPFDAEAVKWSIERMLDPENPGVAAGLLTDFRSITVVDAYTVDIELHEPNEVFVAILAAPLMMIVDHLHYLEVGGDRYGEMPSGTGPFTFASWTPGQRVVLEANPDYWGEVAAAVDRVVFEVIPDESARVLALRTGEIDMAFSVPAEQMDVLEADADIQVFRTPTFRTVFLEMVTQHPFLSRNVRHAISHTVNREQIMAIIGDNGAAAYGHGPEEALGFYAHALDHDLEAAAALLDEEGWQLGSDGFRTRDGERLALSVLARGVTPGEIDALQVIQLQLRAVGIDMAIERVDTAAWLSTMNDAAVAWADSRQVPSHTMWISAAGIRTGEVGYLMNRPMCHQTIRNWSMIACTPEYDQAFITSQSPAPLDERVAAYQVMGEYTEEWQHRVPIFHVQNNSAARNYVQGFVVNPQDSLDLRGVTIAD